MLYWCRGGTENPKPARCLPACPGPIKAISQFVMSMTDLGHLDRRLELFRAFKAEGSHLQLERARTSIRI